MKVVLTVPDKRGKKEAPGKTKRVRASDGTVLTVRALDAGSRTFGRDLRGVFAKNVIKTRKDNKAIAGVRDRAPAKR